MKSGCILFSLLGLLCCTTVSGQLHYKWSQTIGSDQSDLVGKTLPDADGNLYRIANFRDTVDLDPGPGVDLLTRASAYTIAVVKSDPEGNFIWSARFFSNADIGGHMTEIKDGRISLSFRFVGNFIYEFNGERLIDYEVNGGSGCLLTLSTDGEVLNVVYWPRQATWFVENTHTLPDGQMLIQGRFQDSLQIPGSPTLFSHGANDVFLLLLDQNDNIVWAKAFGSVGDESTSEMQVFDETLCYFNVAYNDTVYLDTQSGPITLPASGEYQSAILAVDLQGQLIHGFPLAATEGTGIDAIVLDNSGNLYLAGYFVGTANFAHPSQSPAIYTSLNADDGFVARYTPDGMLDWVILYIGEDYSFVTRLAIARNTELYASGGFSGSTDLDPGPGERIISRDERTDIFIAKLQLDGTQLYVYDFEGNNYEGITDLIVSEARSEVIVSGYYYDTLDCDPSANTALIITNGGSDAFMIAFDEENTLSATHDLPAIAQVTFYPNPVRDDVRIASDQDITGISIHTASGQLVRRVSMASSKEGEIDLSDLAPGTYWISVYGTDTVTTGRIIKIGE